MRRFQQKLIIPSASRPLIERIDLIERLEASISSMRVVALAAPAGWGKTTALAQWAARTTLPMAWYTLDPADSDPLRFLDYLLHAVADFVPDARELIKRLASTPAGEFAQLYHTTALAIAAAPDAFALVLDDFHVLSEAAGPTSLPLIQSLLASLAEYATNCHLVVASRTPPALYGMVRLISQQRAAVFDYTAFQFSSGDVQRLAGMSAGMMLSDASATLLTNQLGGWVTGIVLSLDQVRTTAMADGMQVGLNGHAAERQFVIEADTTRVYAFLAEQVIAPLPESVRIFLEDTSVLDDLSPKRCDTLREATDSARLLDDVKQYGLFVTSRAGWLSYHSLFREFLRTRLKHEPQREKRLLSRAAEIYAGEDEIESAIACCLAADSYDAALVLLREAIPRFRRLSRHTTLLGCFDQLASARPLPLPPDLLVAQARVYSDLALWERAYLAIQLAETLGNPLQQWEALLTHTDFLSIQGDHRAARRVLATVPFEQLPTRLQVLHHMRSGQLAIMDGPIETAIAAFEQAHMLAPTTDLGGDPSVLADIYDNLGWAYMVQGDQQMALRHLLRADACWQAIGNSGRRAMTLNNIGVLQMGEGLRGEARTSFETAMAIARSTGRRREETALLCSTADLDLIEGATAQALSCFSNAYVLAERADLLDLIEYAGAGAFWAATLVGEEAQIERWASISTGMISEPLVRARVALGTIARTFRQPRPNLDLMTPLLSRVAAEEEQLSAFERAALHLALAALRLKRSGWLSAAEPWAHFEMVATQLPEAALVPFLGIYDALFTAAAGTSSLARRMRQATGRTGMRRYQIAALGGFHCRIDGNVIDLSPLHRALLVRLLDAGQQGLSVERLWESVWGESDLSMTALYQAARRLRVQTGLSIAVRDGTCGINSEWAEIAYDVRQLEQILDEPLGREMIERAMGLYRGEFLPGAPDGASYWVETRRAHLQERFLNTLELYANTAEAEHPQLAMQYYQRILQIDGCREQTAVRLMQLAARFGNRSLLNATYEQLSGALRSLNATPGQATASIYRQLQ